MKNIQTEETVQNNRDPASETQPKMFYNNFKQQDIIVGEVEAKSAPNGASYFQVPIKRLGMGKSQGQNVAMTLKCGLNKISGVLLRTNPDGTNSKSIQVFWDIPYAIYRLGDEQIAALTDDVLSSMVPGVAGAVPPLMKFKQDYEAEREKLKLKDAQGNELLPPYPLYLLERKKKINAILTVYLMTLPTIEKSKGKISLPLFDSGNQAAVAALYRSPVYWPPMSEDDPTPKPEGRASTFLKWLEYEKWQTKLSMIGVGSIEPSVFFEATKGLKDAATYIRNPTAKFRMWSAIEILVSGVYIQKGTKASIQLKVTDSLIYHFEETAWDNAKEAREAADANPEVSDENSRKMQQLMARMSQLSDVPPPPEGDEKAEQGPAQSILDVMSKEHAPAAQQDARLTFLQGD